jgi:lantibiotic modifying enzyme
MLMTEAAHKSSRKIRNRGEYLQTAAEIGERLVRNAVWYQHLCNWLGSSPDGGYVGASLPKMKNSTLGPELYSGTSGVALFLAELFARAPMALVRDTALGAIRQALKQAETLPASCCWGLYTGHIGIALAAARVGTLLEDKEIVGQARLLVRRSARTKRINSDFDIMSGNAGAIAALILLRDLLSEPSFIDHAVSLGDELLILADRGDGLLSWSSPALPSLKNLTGFSHGVAGVAYALLELHQVTGASKYLEGAEQAFSYERRWFSAEAANWPDFRQDPTGRWRPKGAVSYAVAWCHGAPGIALSRLRAYELLRKEVYRTEALQALETTRRTTENWLNRSVGNYSLCHGQSGNAEVLLEGSPILGQDSDGVALAYEVGDVGIARHVKKSDWPCGTPGGETPSLMLGLSGIGYFYLRLCDQSVPSILILRP